MLAPSRSSNMSWKERPNMWAIGSMETTVSSAVRGSTLQANFMLMSRAL